MDIVLLTTMTALNQQIENTLKGKNSLLFLVVLEDKLYDDGSGRLQ